MTLGEFAGACFRGEVEHVSGFETNGVSVTHKTMSSLSDPRAITAEAYKQGIVDPSEVPWEDAFAVVAEEIRKIRRPAPASPEVTEE